MKEANERILGKHGGLNWKLRTSCDGRNEWSAWQWGMKSRGKEGWEIETMGRATAVIMWGRQKFGCSSSKEQKKKANQPISDFFFLFFSLSFMKEKHCHKMAWNPIKFLNQGKFSNSESTYDVRAWDSFIVISDRNKWTNNENMTTISWWKKYFGEFMESAKMESARNRLLRIASGVMIQNIDTHSIGPCGIGANRIETWNWRASIGSLRIDFLGIVS